MDSKTRVMVAKSLLKLAKQINAQDEIGMEDTGESEKLLKMNPQLNSVARRLNSLGLGISDMLTAVLMAMKLKGAPASEVNKAFSLMRPMLKRII